MEALCVGAYALFLLAASFVFRATDKADEYLLAGRRVTMPVFVASLVSTWYGGILGVGEYGYKHGVSNWLVFGVPYYLAALIFAFLIAGRARRTGHFTIPDQLLRSYGPRPALIGSIIVFVMTAPAAYVLQLGVLLNVALGWPMVPALIAGAVFSTVYLLRGGLKGDLLTDVVQFVLMFAGFGVLIGYAVGTGGIGFLRSHLPAQHFTWHGGNPPGYILAWYFIALGTLVEPAFYQRCYAARSEGIARWGIVISVLFWMVFDFLTTTAGLYARAMLPGLEDPVAAFPTLGRVLLPPLARGFFIVAMLAIVMSTIDSYLFLGGITLGRDIVWRLRGSREEGRVTAYARAALVVTAGVAVVLALWFRSVVDLWHHLGSVGTPALLLPLGLSFSGRLRPASRTAMSMMLGGGGVALVWLLWPSLPWANAYPASVEPIFPGLAVSLAIYLVDKLRAARSLIG